MPGRGSGGVAMLLAAWAVAMLVGGCGSSARPPISLEELQPWRPDHPCPYTDAEILAFNLDRVLDDRLPDSERIASLSVLLHLDGDNPAVHRELAKLLDLPDRSPVVGQVVLHVLARQDYPDIGPHVARTLPVVASGRLQYALLEWVGRHPQPELLAAVVSHWAKADRTDWNQEKRLRRLVEAMTGQPWSQTLLEELNDPQFLAKGSALGVLSGRTDEAELRRALLAMEAKTTAVEAVQFLIGDLDYLPDGVDLLASVLAYTQRKDQLTAAAAIAKRWAEVCGYRFSIRDLHLLSRLAENPASAPADRNALVASLQQRLTRQTYNWTAGVPHTNDAAGEAAFASRLRQLSMADLVRVNLLCDMLNDGETRRSLRTTAQRDRADRTSQWGGLILYADGRARGRLYLPGERGDDLQYQPSERLSQDAFDCLAYFHGRFDKAGHSDTAPTAADVLRLAELRTPGLILTSTGEDHFAAVYYDTEGIMLPLGTFQFTR